MVNTIAKGKVVGFSYHLRDTEGETLDRSEEPFYYLHGWQNIVPGLELAMEGLLEGDSKNVTVLPEDGYGEYRPDLVFPVPLSQLPNGKIEVGMEFQTETEEGHMVLFVQEVRTEDAILNGNHPLAGKTLLFDVKIHSIREASEEEKSHGHVHGPGGHHH